MKKRFIIYSLVLSSFLGNTLVYGQAGLKKANLEYEKLAYSSAIKYYEQIASHGYVDANLLKKTGNSYYFNGNYPVAYLWYNKLFTDFNNEDIEAEYDFRFAQTLKNVGNNQDAEKYFKLFSSKNSDSSRAKLINDKRDKKVEIQKNSGRSNISLLSINSPYSDYGSSVYDDKLLFTSARDTGNFTKRVFTWTGNAFTKLYSSDLLSDNSLSVPKKISKKIDTKFNESSPIITKDGQTMYFTRNNYNNGHRGTDFSGTTLLKIYRSELKNGKWINITELPFNSDQFNTAHPVLNTSENMMYFVSDRPGGYGNSDIWRVSITSLGFGVPENLGPNINTDGRETFPFITEDNELYFSSDAREGLGGLDIYATKIKSDGSFTKIQNIGSPINSNADDFAYFIDKKTQRGFFSSNREGGFGLDDIYAFIENRALELECIQDLKIFVLDSKTRNKIDNASLTLFEKDNTSKSTTNKMITDHYSFKTSYDCGEVYKIETTAPNYIVKEEVVRIGNVSGITELTILLEAVVKDPIPKTPINEGDDLFKTLNLNPIHFDFDKSNIRPDAALELEKIVKVMKENPTIEIDVRSFTDSRGNDAYNMKLSERRAKSTAEWIISQGILSSRVTYKGYGETHLLNKCTNGVKCTDAEHEVNRRSEFIVTEI